MTEMDIEQEHGGPKLDREQNGREQTAFFTTNSNQTCYRRSVADWMSSKRDAKFRERNSAGP